MWNTKPVIQIEGLSGMGKASVLTFEFECIYKDGQVIKQLADTPSEFKFGDLDISKLKTISLIGKGMILGVDLDGHFNINGVKVQFQDMPIGADYRPIYFRRVKQIYMPEMVEVITKYAVGIQATVDGTNIQKILMVDDFGNLEVISKK